MQRRDFLRTMLAAAVAPAFVPVSRLMRVKPIVHPNLIPPNYMVFPAALLRDCPVDVFNELVANDWESRLRQLIASDPLIVHGTGGPGPAGVITIYSDTQKYRYVRYFG